MRIIDYRDYFYHQVEQHPELNATGEVANMFSLSTFDKALSDTRSLVEVGGYIFRLLIPTWGLSGDAEEALRRYVGGFIIAKNYGARSEDDEAHLQAIDDTERIAGHFAAKMVADSVNGHPLFYGTLDAFEDLHWNAQLLEGLGDGTYLGQFCTFHFGNYINPCTTEQDPAWGDGGYTPTA